MPSVNCIVTGGGGWNQFGQVFPTNQNDGDDGTYQGWPGNIGGSHINRYDYAAIPDGATISDVSVFGNWGAGSAPATAACSCVLGVNSVLLGIINDVGSYGFSIPRPGGGVWTKTDVQNMYVQWSSLQTGNGNNMRLKSSVLVVTYVLGGTFFVAVHH